MLHSELAKLGIFPNRKTSGYCFTWAGRTVPVIVSEPNPLNVSVDVWSFGKGIPKKGWRSLLDYEQNNVRFHLSHKAAKKVISAAAVQLNSKHLICLIDSESVDLKESHVVFLRKNVKTVSDLVVLMTCVREFLEIVSSSEFKVQLERICSVLEHEVEVTAEMLIRQ